jgi:Laminin G domain
VLLVGVLFTASASAGVESASAAWTTMARWEMDEGVNATSMDDSSAADRDGNIGSEVETGVVADGETGYRWPAGDLNVEDPQRLVRATSRAFNPRRDAFSVTVRFKTGVAADQNIIQKGQAPSGGGMWKIEMASSGRVVCLFRGSAGRGAIGSEQGVSLANDEWHTVRCIRRSRAVAIIVDGGEPRKQVRRTGRIANTWPLTIGGKSQCNPPNNVTCQYYVGMLDRAVVKRRR